MPPFENYTTKGPIKYVQCIRYLLINLHQWCHFPYFVLFIEPGFELVILDSDHREIDGYLLFIGANVMEELS